MISILAQASLNRKEITVELAKEMVDKYVKNTSKELSIEYIQKIVCDYLNTPVDKLNVKTRKREVAQARQISMFFAKKYTNLSLSTIGQLCGNKHHATVLHACRTISNLYETDKSMKICIDEIEKKLEI
jgi:chromosomal replication initiator protein